ncbi:MAG: hypothetical protein HY909_17485, partial [Deltaproteobacteria bacterium]|nr:hypothetical protein [Deltaproteobacteria bacterium]
WAWTPPQCPGAPPPPPPDGGSPPPPPPGPGAALRAFPGAEGFGAGATGGRGGRVVFVTNLNSSGSGSLADALRQSGPRTVVFRVSGVISGTIQITTRDVTIAGQTSPGGITIRGGLYCDNVYDPYDCRNVIVRHLRMRNLGEDCMRMGGTERIMVDHVSLENAGDECMEISRTHDLTLQYSLLGEPVGDHYRFGGILINYSKDVMTLDNLTLHHNIWNGSHGRVPEISCEENGDGRGRTNCAGRILHTEISNNVVFDSFDPLWYNRCVGLEGNDCAPSSRDFLLYMNWIGNVTMRRASLAEPMFSNDVGRGGANRIFFQDNLFRVGGGSSAPRMVVASQPSRFPYPNLTIHPSSMIVPLLQQQAGAFPRDPMDTRILGYMSGSVDARPPAWGGGVGIDRGDAFRTNTPAFAPPADSDNDGMADDWERTNGLNPSVADNNGTSLSMRFTGVEGYTNLECYLNALSDERVRTGR